MSAFQSGKQVESDAYQRLRPLIAHWSDNGQFVVTDKGPMSKLLQEMVGDLAMNRGGDVLSLELKAEVKNRGNFFFEEWSNYPRNETTVPNPGWGRKTNATFIWYYFLDTDDLYIFRRLTLQHWLYGSVFPADKQGLVDVVDGGVIYNPEHRDKIRQKVQGKYNQLNTTVGFIIPISFVTSRVRHKHVRVNEFIQQANVVAA